MELSLKKFALPKMLFSLPMAILAAGILIFINDSSYQESRKALTNIELAQKTRDAISTLLRQMLDAETGQRGFLLTGDPGYLAPYDSATANSPRWI